jgi:hypothetical protein
MSVEEIENTCTSGNTIPPLFQVMRGPNIKELPESRCINAIASWCDKLGHAREELLNSYKGMQRLELLYFMIDNFLPHCIRT